MTVELSETLLQLQGWAKHSALSGFIDFSRGDLTASASVPDPRSSGTAGSANVTAPTWLGGMQAFLEDDDEGPSGSQRNTAPVDSHRECACRVSHPRKNNEPRGHPALASFATRRTRAGQPVPRLLRSDGNDTSPGITESSSKYME